VFDLHVHTAPDVQERACDDTTMARRYEDSGFTGFVLKGHYADTTARAAAMSRITSVRAYGGIVLNSQVGGFNPVSVWSALQMGARIIWMPTIDALAHRRAGLERPYPPRVGLQAPAYSTPPLDRAPEFRLRLILDLIAESDAVLATGHLSAPEIQWLLTAAEAAGVQRILMTHPTYTVPALSHDQVAAFAARGAIAEITAFQFLQQAHCDAAGLAELIRTVGASRVVLSSDVGQPASPMPARALATLIDALAAEGIAREQLEAMAGRQAEQLVIP